jgi:hypothetical protein
MNCSTGSPHLLARAACARGPGTRHPGAWAVPVRDKPERPLQLRARHGCQLHAPIAQPVRVAAVVAQPICVAVVELRFTFRASDLFEFGRKCLTVDVSAGHTRVAIGAAADALSPVPATSSLSSPVYLYPPRVRESSRKGLWVLQLYSASGGLFNAVLWPARGFEHQTGKLTRTHLGPRRCPWSDEAARTVHPSPYTYTYWYRDCTSIEC